jgi:surface protein
MNIYLDGQLIYEYSGTNLRNQSSYDPDKHDTFIKLGMYTEIRDERVIYFDNIEMSNHIDSDISNWIQTPSSGITPITDSNFETAINTCLTTNPIDGMCTTSQYGAMPNWDVSNVTNMRNAFKDKVNFNADISSWNVSSVTDMYSIFGDAAAFNQDISSWDVNNVADMGYMFSRATIFNQDISSWDVSGVTNMKYMFRDASNFNQDIGSWDVSDVNSMTYMFKSATTFNQNISGWCVSNITNEPVSFSIGSSLLESNKPIWGTCPDSSLSVEDNLKSILKIYPNPTKNSWKISTLKIIKSIELYDIVGRKVFWIVNPKSKDFELNGTSLSKGFYILVLNGKRKFRLIKN